MQTTAKKLKGYQWYNRVTEREFWGVEMENVGTRHKACSYKNKTPILRGIERTFCCSVVILGFEWMIGHLT